MTFSQPETDTLIALMDRIIPEDDHPAASQAGVMHYISRLFETDLAKSLDWFRTGLNCLDLESEARHGCPFLSLTSQLKDEVAASLESGKVRATWEIAPAQFMRMCINIVSEGYYADPANGGNRDAASWKMIGFEIKEGVRLPVASMS